MRKLLFLLMVLLVASCGEPPPKEGDVIDKVYEPAHWESGYRTEHYQDCGMHYDFNAGEYRYSCKPETRQVYEAEHYFAPDAWKLRLENCHRNDKDELKCKRGWLRVDETTYHSYGVGDHYPELR